MGQCLWCGRKGFLVKTTENGVCMHCQRTLEADIVPRTDAIAQRVRDMKATTDYRVIIQCLDDIIGNAKELMKYHEKGISVGSKTPPQLISECSSLREQAYREMIASEGDKKIRP